MSLDIRLRRDDVEEPWGFRLAGGGGGCGAGGDQRVRPLTVLKVEVGSPAEKGGLRPGDRVLAATTCRPGAQAAPPRTHGEARGVIRAARDRLQLQVLRGRYDAVLDDQEPIFEPIEPDDFVPPSDPTEVFMPIPELSLPLPELPPLPEDAACSARSQTASPFLLPTKPYRSFSTEPIVEVPPLEDPIILNSNYHDEFGNPNEDFLPKTKFKLPISEQYDPDFGKEKKEKKFQATSEVANQKCEVMTQEEVSFLKQMKTDIDLDKMEETSMNMTGFQSNSKSSIEESATSILIKDAETKKEETIKETAMAVVDESIVKAVSVAEEIKKETQIELHSFEVNAHVKKSMVEAKGEIVGDLILKESNVEAIGTVSETVNEELKSKEKSFESFSRSKDTKSVSAKEEIQETIAAGTVKRLSSTFDKEMEIKDLENKKYVQKQKIIDIQEKSQDYKTDTQTQKEIVTSKQSVTSDQKTKKTEVKTDEKPKMSTGRLLAEQRAYTIGLQTIPNIKGSIHSSYHYDLLLKTFFIHLTDVMVALSRFILAEPVINKTEGITSDVSTANTFTKEVKYRQKEDTKEMAVKEELAVKSDFIEHIKENKNISEETVKIDRFVKYEEEMGEKKKSGAEMAQRTTKTSKQLIEGMGAVITEFQTKTGIEDKTSQTTEVHERSRSRIEEEVSKESDPLEWLSKSEVQTTSKELSEVKQTTESSRTEQTLMDTRNLEVRENHDRSRSKSRDGRTIYVATVESHVYTNKDEILENQFLDTSSEEAMEVNKSIAVESAAVETSQDVETVLEEVQEAAKFIAEKIGEKQMTKTERAVSKMEQTFEQMFEVKIDNELQKMKELEARATQEETKSIKIENKKENRMIVEETETIQQKLYTENAVEKIEISKVPETETIPQVEIKEEEEQVVVLRRPSDIKAEESTAIVQVPKEVSPPFVQETQVSESFIAEATFEAKATFKSIRTEETAVFETKTEEKTLQETSQNQQTSFTELSSTEMQKQRESLRKLSLKSDKSLTHSDSFPSTISTPTPATVPPTPLTDEYVFRLECQMKHLFPSEPAQEEPSPEKEIEHEDPYTTNKKLIPHIETNIERIVYDPPLATPIEVKDVPTLSPLNGELKQKVGEEELREIERKSSLLASVIDETVKSIEEYNEQICMDSKKEIKIKEEFLATTAVEENNRSEQVAVESKIKTETETKPMYASFVKEAKTTVFADAMPVIAKETTKYEENSKIAQNAQVDYLSSLLSTNVTHVTGTATTDSVLTAVAEQDVMSSIYSAQSEISVTDRVSEQTRESNQVTFKVADLKALTQQVEAAETSCDALRGYRPVSFNPEEIRRDIEPPAACRPVQVSLQNQGETEIARPRSLAEDAGAPLGTTQGFVDALGDPVLDAEVGKPGLSEEQIAELVSGESEMLREAHVMGLSRVIASHMTRPADNDSSIDFNKIKPTIEKLKDSEVLKVLNEELTKTSAEKKEDERKWTTFLQRPQRSVPQPKFGQHGWLPQFIPPQEEYKVRIVKQPKPKVAPDYKPEEFETGLLPWEERAAREPPPPPPTAEEPILVPEEQPLLLQAVDPLPEGEVPDLEDTGIPLPPEKTEEEQPAAAAVEQQTPLEAVEEEQKETEEAAEEREEETKEMEQSCADLLTDLQTMVDPSAPLEQQLAQMRVQLAALAHLPAAIQQSLEIVTNQLLNMSHQETKAVTETTETMEITEVTEVTETKQESVEESTQQESMSQESVVEEVGESKQAPAQPPAEEIARMREEEALMLEERERIEKQKKVARDIVQEMIEQQLEHESRLVKHHATPRATRPKPAFGPLTPAERPLVLPGGRKWHKPKDAYNDAFFAETLAAQAEIIQGKAKGINFMKYEKPPVTLDHLKDSEVYKLVHGEESASAAPLRRVDLLTTVVAECDYREKCRSMTPSSARPLDLTQQHQP